MNYRHIFHAGNFADVHKHVVLIALLDRLLRKPTPLFYLDTHAGRGAYELNSADAERGGEWRHGVARLTLPSSSHHPLVQRYRALVGAEQNAPSHYPGSPLLAAQVLRDSDRLVLVEQQAPEAQVLERALPSRRGMSVICGDGYAALKTYLPPRENRGLVLIDPPYEAEAEFTRVLQALQLGLKRWPTGVFAVWYPIKASADVGRFHAALKNSALRKLLLLELSIRPLDSPLGLNGSGVLIANPPWQFDIDMRAALQDVHSRLSPDRVGGVRVEWLVGE